MPEFWNTIKRRLPVVGVQRANVSFRADAVTGSARLVREPRKKPGVFDYLMQGLRAFSIKWVVISVLLTSAVFFIISIQQQDTGAYQAALQGQVARGDWQGGLHSLFILRMVNSPRPLEFLVMIILAPIIWNTLPPRWRFIIFPIIAQMMYMLLSQAAFLPLEFAIMNMFSNVADSLRQFTF